MAYEEIVTTGNIPGLNVKSKTSYITAKTTGDYTWLSETDINGGAISGAKSIAVGLAVNAENASYADRTYSTRCIQTFKNGKNDTYGDQYPVYFQWNASGTRCIAKNDGYLVHATGAPSIITVGHNNSGFSFVMDGDSSIYEITVYSPYYNRYWKAVAIKVDSGIYANAIAASSDFDSTVGFTFNASSNPTVNIRWNSSAWMSYSVIKHSGSQEA